MGLKLPEKKPLNKFIRLSGVGIQMGVTIYLASYVGKKLDVYYGMEKKVFTLGLILFAFIASIYSILAQLKKIQDDK
ncbi:AtpZ/AtpI family protein [Flavicella sediminum]|uniref:AtpZ/AtpI family protein n=1 Tax=Flavicella sediminum TaxID=2585141 RepID=UPI0011226537|nr:AtpZ/AtpI family protein [Flavicella sediminum]